MQKICNGDCEIGGTFGQMSIGYNSKERYAGWHDTLIYKGFNR